MTSSERIAVRVAVFLGGAMLMALEIAAFRIIGKTFGSALRETTAVIAVFLAAMSLGYWAGGRAGDRWPRLGTLIAVFLAAAAMLVFVPWLDAATSPRIAESELDYALHAFLATSILFAVPTFLFASISPIAVRLMATTTVHSGSTAGSISALSTVGSIVGSILTGFFLIDWLQSIARTVLFVALCACITAAILILAALPRMRAEQRAVVRRYAIVAGVTVAVIVLPAFFFIRSTRLERSLLTPSPNWKVLFAGDSAYHHILVRESRRGVRLLTFNAGIQSKMNVNDPYGPGNDYIDTMHLSRLMRPNVRKILNIGIGGGTAAKQYVHYYSDTVVDLVDVDPMVIDVAQRFFRLEPSERLRVHLGDGRMFLKRSPGVKWDVIIIDTYTTNRYGDTIPPHLVTREFFEEVSQHLEDDGIVQFHCAFSTTKLLPALIRTMSEVFPSVRVTRGEIFGSFAPMLTSNETLAERARPYRLPYLPNYLADFGPRPVSTDVPILTDDFAPVDLLVRGRR